MPYDEDLANRIRELVLSEPGVVEQRMFGGLAFPRHALRPLAAEQTLASGGGKHRA